MTVPSPTPFAWPTLADFRQHCGGGLAKQTKLALRYAWSRHHAQALADAVAASADWIALMRPDLRRLYPALTYFMDRRLRTAARFDAMCTDLQRARAAFAGTALHTIGTGQHLSLCALGDDLQLMLGPNGLSYHEGLWSLSLRDAAGTRLYSLSFAFWGDDAILIGSVQGARAAVDSHGSARDLTKQCHGLRPAPLLIEALRSLAAATGTARLLAIDPHHHVKGRWNLRERRLQFDYRSLWAELGAERTTDGHWRLPSTATRRSDAEMPTRKRAMYRRRYEMLDRVDAAIAQALRGDAAAADAPTAPTLTP